MRQEPKLRRKRHRDRMFKVFTGLLTLVIAGLGAAVFLLYESPNTSTPLIGGETLWSTQQTSEEFEVDQNGQRIVRIAEPVMKATLVAVGDNLIHQSVYDAGMLKPSEADGTRDYSTLYEHIKPYVQEADISVINQETICGGDENGFQDYPRFNTPSDLINDMVDTGFNVVLQASNHSMDMGLDGLLHAYDFWKTEHPEVMMIGITKEEKEEEEIPVLTVNGIRIAMLNYSYSHNSNHFSTNAEGHLNMLCAFDEKSRQIDFHTINPKVISDIEKAEKLADFTIVFPHWGTEYVLTETKQESDFAALMVQAGADLIIGAHPHVCQPVKWVETENGNRGLCYYSLGNFTSAQDGLAQMMGCMASLTIQKDGSGTHIDEASIKAIPLVTHFVYPGINHSVLTETTYLLDEYTEELAAVHGLKRVWHQTITKEKLMNLAEQTFGEFMSLR